MTMIRVKLNNSELPSGDQHWLPWLTFVPLATPVISLGYISRLCTEILVEVYVCWQRYSNMASANQNRSLKLLTFVIVWKTMHFIIECYKYEPQTTPTSTRNSTAIAPNHRHLTRLVSLTKINHSWMWTISSTYHVHNFIVCRLFSFLRYIEIIFLGETEKNYYNFFDASFSL